MKVTVVPAQVTTVEDRIIGNLSMLQLMLLLVPVFVGFGLFSLLPPFMEGSAYKYLLLGFMGLVCAGLSIRVRGRVLVSWLITLTKYYSRPGVYVYNKNSSYLRENSGSNRSSADRSGVGVGVGVGSELDDSKYIKASELRPLPPVLAEVDTKGEIEVFDRINRVDSPVRFEVDHKGGLYVRIRETEA